MVTQIDHQLGIKTETAYGTLATVDRFFEFTDEGLELVVDRLESKGIRTGKRVQRSDRWAPGEHHVNGPVKLELYNKSMGLWLKHMFGAVITTGPVTGVSTHVFSPADLNGLSFTAQKGVVDEGGTARALTYQGCKIKDWELSAKVGEIGSLQVNVNAQDETQVPALATASFPASMSLLTFVQATLTVAGSPLKVREATIKGDNKLTIDRFFDGSPLCKEPKNADWQEYTGTLDGEFEDLTAYNRFVNGTEAALSLAFVGGIAGGAIPFSLTIAGNVRFDGETPKVSGAGVVPQPLPIKFLDPNTGAAANAISATYVTTDAAP